MTEKELMKKIEEGIDKFLKVDNLCLTKYEECIIRDAFITGSILGYSIANDIVKNHMLKDKDGN